MKTYFGYIRVSTARQGVHGVSLIEQRAAIERYALGARVTISEWFEERETAAKCGRPVFTRMLALLRKGKAAGVIIHKIDRSARNLRDWADLGEMIDAGIEVHFAADALDLNSRGGRLSADIQAVVAADYIRNLREETRKGFYGRLKQGFYPLPAPVGYLDQGGGQPKIADMRVSPLVRVAFDLYATGKYSLCTLQEELHRRGLRNKRGGQLSLNGLSTLLHNPFYCGLIRLRRTGETFKGVHEPLITAALFERVQRLLKGKCGPKVVRHELLFRRLLHCAQCKRVLVGERQKGHVYYRCHTAGCLGKTIREDRVEDVLRDAFSSVSLADDDVACARIYIESEHARTTSEQQRSQATYALQLSDARARMDRLTDALLDGIVDRPTFEERKGRLMVDIARLEEQASERQRDVIARVAEALELATHLTFMYERGTDDERRRLVETTTAALSLDRDGLVITLSEPFLTFADQSVDMRTRVRRVLGIRDEANAATVA